MKVPRYAGRMMSQRSIYEDMKCELNPSYRSCMNLTCTILHLLFIRNFYREALPEPSRARTQYEVPRSPSLAAGKRAELERSCSPVQSEPAAGDRSHAKMANEHLPRRLVFDASVSHQHSRRREIVISSHGHIPPMDQVARVSAPKDEPCWSCRHGTFRPWS